MTSKLRAFLHDALSYELGENRRMDHWAFTPQDEHKLFEFIHPSVNTRDDSFRLFNLSAEWDGPVTCLVDSFGKQIELNLADLQMDGQSISERYRAEHPVPAADPHDLTAGW